MKFVVKKLCWFVLVLQFSAIGLSAAETEMEQTFQSPPVAARPWTYWWWLNSNVTREGITRDLEEMNRQGIQGVMIFNAGGGDTSVGPKFLSPEWNALFKFALSEASRLGMEASVSLCDGWCAGGPWIPAEAANKKLTWSETQVDGAANRCRKRLPLPPTIDNFYRDVAVLAIREKAPRPVQPGRDSRQFRRAAATAMKRTGRRPTWPTAIRTRSGGPRSPRRPTRRPGSITSIPNRSRPRRSIWPRPRTAVRRTAPCKSRTTAYRSRPSTPGRWPRARPKRVEFPEVKAKVFRLVVQSVHTPDVRLAEMWLLRKGDEPALRPGIKWWRFKSGNRGFWYWPKARPGRHGRGISRRRRGRLQEHGSRRSHLEDGQGRQARMGRARGPLDHPALRLHARRPAHPLLLDRHRLRSRHARSDRHRNPFQALRRAACWTPPANMRARR